MHKDSFPFLDMSITSSYMCHYCLTDGHRLKFCSQFKVAY